MLKTRVLPCLLLDRERLVKTVQFKDPSYIGDPINAVRIFNTKEVDELVLVDITATFEKRKPSFELIAKISDECRMPLTAGGGSQAIVVSIDVQRHADGRYEAFSQGVRKASGLHPVAWAKTVEEKGAGEIFLNSIDRDGTMRGYDVELIRQVSEAVSIPVIACGGAGKLEDFREAVHAGGASAVAAGSFFVFHGRRRAVLINFPTKKELESVLSA